MPASQEAEQRQKWQAKNRKVIAFDPLEQMHPQSLKLIGTDARRDDPVSRCFHIGGKLGVAHRPHGHSSHRDMFKDDLSVLRNRNGRMKLMAMSGEHSQLIKRLGAVLRLVEKAITQRQRLIGADDKMSCSLR